MITRCTRNSGAFRKAQPISSTPPAPPAGRIIAGRHHPRCGLLESAVDESGIIQPFAGDTAIFITPGYKLRAVDGLDDQFPPAQIDPDDAGQRVDGTRSG